MKNVKLLFFIIKSQLAKQLLFTFYLVVFINTINLFSQPINFCGSFPSHTATSTNPDSIIYDRFGNSYDISDLAINPIPISSGSTGNFELYYVGVPSAWKEVIEQAFSDVSSWIDQRNAQVCDDPHPIDKIKVLIDVANIYPALGIGSGYYQRTPGHDPCSNVANNECYNILNGGGNYNLFNNGYNAHLTLHNTSTFSNWYYGLSSPAGSGKYDMYTVILHEIMHTMAFDSRIKLDGTAFGNSYSLWDSYLYKAGTFGSSPNPTYPILYDDCDKACWNLNSTLYPNQSSLTSSVGNSCSTGNTIVFASNGGSSILLPIMGGNGTAPTTDGQMGNALSHLNPSCNGINADYLMQPSIDINIRRTVTAREFAALCALGYKINSNPNYSDCDGCFLVNTVPYAWAAKFEKGITCCKKLYYACTSEELHIPKSELLCSILTNGTKSVTFLEHAYGLAPSSITETSTEFIFTFSEDGTSFINYTVSTCDCKMTVIQFPIEVGPCHLCTDNDPCVNLVCSNGFEEFTENSGVPISFSLGAPAVFKTDGTSTDICVTGGNTYAFIGTHPSNTEGIAMHLTDPINPGCTLKIKVKLSLHPGYSSPLATSGELNIMGAETAPCNPDENYINYDCVARQCNSTYIFNPYCLGTIPFTNVASFSPGEYCPSDPNFVEYEFSYYHPCSATYNLEYIILTGKKLHEGGIFLDDLVITKNCADANYTKIIDCPKVTFIPDCPILGNTYSWVFGDGGTSTEVSPMHTYIHNGTYITSLTVTDECGNTAYTSMEAVIDCEGGSGYACPCLGAHDTNIDAGPGADITSFTAITGALTSTTLSPHTFSVHCLAIKGRLIIPDNYDFALQNGEVRMQPGSEIIVKKGAKLSLYNIRDNTGTNQGIHSCEMMWKGINVFNSARLYFKDCVIQDAQYAIKMNGISNLDCLGNIFDRNYVGIYTPTVSTKSDPTKIINNYPIYRNVFTCTSNLNSPYTDQTPDPGSIGLAGVLLNKGYLNLYPFVSSHFTVGNTFTKVKNGIIGKDNSSVSVGNNIFTEFDGATTDVNSAPLTANGIYMQNSTAIVYSNIFNHGSESYNNDRAIHIDRSSLFGSTNFIDMYYGLSCVKGDNQIINFIADSVLYRQTGVGYDLCTNASVLQLAENKIYNTDNTKSGYGIRFNGMNSVYESGTKTVLSNILKTNRNGIFLNSDEHITLGSNYVGYNTSTVYTSNPNYGIYLSGSNDNYLYDNHVFSTGGSTAPNTMDGFRNSGSPDNSYCCNTASLVNNGVNFVGSSTGTSLRHTEITTCKTGLRYNVGAFNMAQKHTGNKWLGSYSGNITAAHYGSTIDIVNSLYFVEDSDPGTSGVQMAFPLWPVGWITPNSSEPWFKFLEGSSQDCEDDVIECPSFFNPFPPGDGYKYWHKNIARGEILATTNGSTANWDAQRYLYRKILLDPTLITIDTVLDSFYLANASTPLGYIGKLEMDIRNIHRIELVDKANLDYLQSKIDETNSDLSLADNLIATAATAYDTIVKINAKTLLQKKLAIFSDSRLQLLNRLNEKAMDEATDLLSSISTYTPTNVLDENDYIVYNIYLELIASNSNILDTPQFAAIKDIAEQCVYTGGEAVLRARALYNLNEFRIFEDEEYCSPPPVKPLNTNEVINSAFSLQPNPASNNCIVSFKAHDAVMQVELRSITGALIKVYDITKGAENLELDLSSYTDGLYIVRLVQNNRTLGAQKLNIIKF